MPRVTHVKKAQKDIPNTDIKKGDSYYWWKFRFGGKYCSKTYPKQSQLTQSDFLSQLYDLQDKIAEFTTDNKDDFDNFKDEILSDIESLKDECQEKLDNMPEHLQYASSSGELLQERINALDDWYYEIESVECEFDEEEMKSEIKEENEKEEGESEENYQERIAELLRQKEQEIVDQSLSEVQDASCEL